MPFKNSLTTPPVVWYLFGLRYSCVLPWEAPGGVLEFFARTPRLCGMYLGLAYSFDLKSNEDMILALARQFKQLSHEPEKFR